MMEIATKVRIFDMKRNLAGRNQSMMRIASPGHHRGVTT